jgi:hypothetical protein
MPIYRSARANWGMAVLAWVALFALFCMAPSHMCQATLSALSFCVSGAPPIGLAFMPVKEAPLDKFWDAAVHASTVWIALMVALILFRMVWPRKPSKMARRQDGPF